MKKQKIIYLFRKKKSLFYSIENVFRSVIDNLPKTNYEPIWINLPEHGFHPLNFIYILTLRWRYPDAIFHVTGDCQYASIFLLGKKSILTVHDCGSLSVKGRVKSWIIRRLYLQAPVKATKAITAISDKTAEEIVAITKTRKKISIIPNPVTGDLFFSRSVFNRIKPQMLFLGAAPHKNLNRTISALKGLFCTINIIGQPDEATLKQLYSSGIDFRLEKNLSDKDLALRFFHCDIILFPSTYEGFGLPILEGFVSGRPVITSDLAPMNRIAGGAACLVDPFSIVSIREGVLKVIEDAAYRAELVQKGLEVSKLYDPQVIAGKYRVLYDSLTDDKGKTK